MFWYLSWCVSDIYRASFYRLFTKHRTSLETSSPPATSVHQDDTLIYAVFVLETLNFFFATGLWCQPGSQQLCISKLSLINILSTLYLCLDYHFRAHSVFYTTHFVYFSMPYSLISHHSCFLCVFYSVWYRKQFEGIYCIYVTCQQN